MAVFAGNRYRTIQFDELDIYDNGEIEKPSLVSTIVNLTAAGTWDGPAGLDEEWGQKIENSDTWWLWSYNDGSTADDWDEDDYVVAWLESDGTTWKGFTETIKLYAPLNDGASQLLAAASASAALLLTMM